MAEQVLIQPYLKLDNGGTVSDVDLSDHIEELVINNDSAMNEFVTGNPGGTVVYKRRLPGAVDFNVAVKFSDDFASGSVDDTLTKLLGSSFTVVAAMAGSTPSATNTVWTFTGTFDKLPRGGAVGSHLEKQVTLYLASGVPVGANS
jgi:hypothetical protein